MRKNLLRIDSLRTRQNACGHILVGFSFLVLTLLTVKTLAPDLQAETTGLKQAVVSDSMSVSKVAMLNVVPASTQASTPAAPSSLSWNKTANFTEDALVHSGYTYSGRQNGSSKYTDSDALGNRRESSARNDYVYRKTQVERKG